MANINVDPFAELESDPFGQVEEKDLFDAKKFKMLGQTTDEGVTIPKGFRPVLEESLSVHRHEKTIFEKVMDYLGVRPARAPKTAPMITEEGLVDNPSHVHDRVEREVMAVVGRGMNSASFGAYDMLQKAINGEVNLPETTAGTFAGSGMSLVGFLKGGPFAAAKFITGSRLAPTAAGLRYVAQAMAEGGATLGIAGGLSTIIPAIMESESLTDAGLDVLKSAATDTLIGALFPVAGFIENKALRVAVGLAVMDKIRAGTGEWFTIDDVVIGIKNGTIDKKSLAEATFGYLMDIYFLSKVPSMRKQLANMQINKMVDEISKQTPEEAEQAILTMVDAIGAPGSETRAKTGLDLDVRQQTWEDYKDRMGLRVALKDKNGTVYEGKEGDIHPTLEARLTKEVADSIVEDGFIDRNGHYYSRAEAIGLYRKQQEAAQATQSYASIGEFQTNVKDLRPDPIKIEDLDRMVDRAYGDEKRRIELLLENEDKPWVADYLKNVNESLMVVDGLLKQRNVFNYDVQDLKLRLLTGDAILNGKDPWPVPVYVSAKAGDKDTVGLLLEKDGTFKMFEGNDEASAYTLRLVNELLGTGDKEVKVWTNQSADVIEKIRAGKPPEGIFVSPSREHAAGYWGEGRELISFKIKMKDVNQTSEVDWQILKPEQKIQEREPIQITEYPSVETYQEKEGDSVLFSATDYKTNAPSIIDLPELVGVATDLMHGRYPEIMKRLRWGKGLARGVFIGMGEGVIKLKAAIFKDVKQALWTLGHEVGHLVDWLPDHVISGNVLGKVKVVKDNMSETITGVLATDTELTNELKNLTQILKPFNPADNPAFTKYRYSPAELYADSITALVNNPGLLKRVAPKFYDLFFDNLALKPEVEEVYERMQDDIRIGAAKDASIKRLREGFDKADKDFTNEVKEKSKWDAFAESFITELHYVIKRVKRLGNTFSPEMNPVYKWEDYVYRMSLNQAYVRDISAKVLKALDNVGADYKDFREWIYHQAVINSRKVQDPVTKEMVEIANPEGFYPARSQERIDEMKQKMPDHVRAFEEAHKAFWEVRKEYFIDVAKDMGIYSDELMKRLEDNEFYATFQVQEYFRQQFGEAAAARIFHQVGTLKKIKDPFAQTLAKDMSLMNSLLKIRAVRSVLMTCARTGELNPAKKRWNGMFREIVEPDNPDQGLLVDMVKGKPVGYYVPKEVVRIFEKNPLEGEIVARILNATMKPFKIGFTEINYGFWMFNVIRDYMRAVRNTPGATFTNFIGDYLSGQQQAFKEMYGKELEPNVQDALKKGMLISVADTRGMRDEDTQLERLLRKMSVKDPSGDSIMGMFNNALTWWTNIGRASEWGTKMGVKQFVEKRFPEFKPDEVAHIVRNSGSPDFLSKGRAFSYYNNMLLFSNAMKEGYRGDFNALKANPTEFMWKMAKYVFLPKTIQFLALQGYLGDDTRKIMAKASEFDLTNYLILPIGLQEEGDKGIYLRLPLDEFGRFFGGVYWKMLNRRFAMEEGDLFDYLAGQAPGFSPFWSILGDVGQYATGHNPYDPFRGRYAIPDQEWRAHDMRTHWEFIRYTYNRTLGTFFARVPAAQDVRVRSELEKVLSWPIVGNSLGRFLKITNYGDSEHLRKDVLAPIQEKRAREILDVHEAVAKIVNSESLTEKDWNAIIREELRGGDVVNRAMMIDLGRRYGSVYLQALLSASTKEEKAAILREIANKKRKIKGE